MNEERMYNVLVSPLVSEKTATDAEMYGRHTFTVAPDATKIEVKRAVEKIFDVKVVSVQISNSRGKVKRHGISIGKRADTRKAVVRLAEGQDIDYMGLEG